MKRMIVLACIGFVVMAQEKSGPDKSSPDLGWLAGSWQTVQEDGSVWEEHWLPPRGGTSVAVTRWVKGRNTMLYELSAIEQGEKGPVLRLRHFGPGLVPWRNEIDGPETWPFKSAKEKEIIFEDPKKDFPRRMVYRRPSDEVLVARLEGEEREVEFRFKRVK